MQSARVAKAHAERMAALERRSRTSATTAATSAQPIMPAKLPGALSITPRVQTLTGRTSLKTPTSPGTPGLTVKRGDNTDGVGVGKENGSTKGDMAALGMTAVHLGMHEEGLEILREAECWHELIEVLQVQSYIPSSSSHNNIPVSPQNSTTIRPSS